MLYVYLPCMVLRGHFPFPGTPPKLPLGDRSGTPLRDAAAAGMCAFACSRLVAHVRHPAGREALMLYAVWHAECCLYICAAAAALCFERASVCKVWAHAKQVQCARRWVPSDSRQSAPALLLSSLPTRRPCGTSLQTQRQQAGRAVLELLEISWNPTRDGTGSNMESSLHHTT